jgi:hypothetical protein
VIGLGRDRPMLFLSNHFEETPRELSISYADRNQIEDGLGISANFFHPDCLASEVRPNVEFDAALTVIATRTAAIAGWRRGSTASRRPTRNNCTADSSRPPGP